MTPGLTPRALGIQASVWTDSLEPADLAPAFDEAASIGYDLVELIVPDPLVIDAEPIIRAATGAGVQLGMVTALRLDSDVSGADPEGRRRGEAHLTRSVQVAAELGVQVLGGVLYGGLGRHTTPPDGDSLARSVEVIDRIGGLASRHGVTLGLEVVSRYGSNLLNTADQARDYCDQVSSDAVGVHLDTFHMNIEERDVGAAVAAVAPYLVHVHIGDNDRGPVGQGRFEFDEFYAALAAAEYRGAMVVEAFSLACAPATATATASWRQLWTDARLFGEQAMSFIQSATAATSLAYTNSTKTGSHD